MLQWRQKDGGAQHKQAGKSSGHSHKNYLLQKGKPLT